MHSKLIPLIFAFILIAFTRGYGQNFEGGLVAGINASNFNGGPSYGLRQIGFTAGGFVHLRLGAHYGFRPEMNFTMKGARKPPNPDAGDYFLYRARLNYIEAPFLFTYTQNNFLYEIGPSVGFLVHSFEELDNSSILERPFRPLDFSFNIGLNYRLSDNWDMNWRFSHSIIPVRLHQGNSTAYLNWGEHNMVLSIRFIYWLRGKNGKE
jgi:hypothetical protein